MLACPVDVSLACTVEPDADQPEHITLPRAALAYAANNRAQLCGGGRARPERVRAINIGGLEADDCPALQVLPGLVRARYSTWWRCFHDPVKVYGKIC